MSKFLVRSKSLTTIKLSIYKKKFLQSYSTPLLSMSHNKKSFHKLTTKPLKKHTLAQKLLQVMSELNKALWKLFPLRLSKLKVRHIQLLTLRLLLPILSLIHNHKWLNTLLLSCKARKSLLQSSTKKHK